MDEMLKQQRAEAAKFFSADAVKLGGVHEPPKTFEEALSILKQKAAEMRNEGVQMAHMADGDLHIPSSSVRISVEEFRKIRDFLRCEDVQVREAARYDVALRFDGYAKKKVVLFYTGGGYITDYEPYDRIQDTVLKRLPDYSPDSIYSCTEFVNAAVYEALRVPYSESELQTVTDYIIHMMHAKNLTEAKRRLELLVYQDIKDVEATDRQKAGRINAGSTSEVPMVMHKPSRKDVLYSLTDARSLRESLEGMGYHRNLNKYSDPGLPEIIASVMRHDDAYLRDIIQNRVIDGLHYWIKDKINLLSSQKFGIGDYQDLYNDVRGVILSMLPGYSSRYMITTYLDGAVSQTILQNSNKFVSRHDYELMNQIRKAAGEYRKETGEDISDPYFEAPFRFQVYFEKNYHAVSSDRWVDIINLMNRSTQCSSLDANPNSANELISSVPTPEQALDQELAREEVARARSTFTNLEYFLSECYIDLLDRKSSACTSVGSKVISYAHEQFPQLSKREIEQAYQTMIEKIRSVRKNEARKRKYRPIRDTSDDTVYNNDICFYENEADDGSSSTPEASAI